MAQTQSFDPRAVRTRTSLQNAFKDLLRIKSYQKITITDITEGAGIARHTFYNHYETKQDLLDNMVDSVLDQFFLNLDNWNLFLAEPDEEKAMLTAFFQAWKDHEEIVNLLKSIDIEFVIMERLKVFFTRFFYEKVSREMPSVDLELARYVISFNAYSLLGLLIPWFESGMNQKPEDLAGFYNQLAGSGQRRKAVEKFQDIFR
jgi:AcrR family transcriptional regulator